MSFSELDLVARGGALSLLALLTALLLRDHRHTVPARMASALMFGIACSVIAEAHGITTFDQPLNFVLVIGEAAVSGFFWLFVRSWFNDEVRFGWQSWALIGVTLALSFANYALWTPERGNFWPTDLPMRALWLGLALAGLWVAWQGRENDLIEARRRLRIGFVWATGSAVVVINLIYAVNNLTSLERTAPAMSLAISLVTLAVTGGICAAVLGFRRSDIFLSRQPPARNDPPADDSASALLANRVQAHVAEQRAYRDETLTIAALAAQLGEPEYRLRRAINGRLGHRNFAAFLNGYRLAEVKAALSDPAQRDVPILTIALDAGFGSLATFNRAFRDSEATTPSAYRAAALAPPRA
ncbi:MAG: helix-turn-helix domain-containing protein [Sphingomonas sp.]|uniref:AraC family transcriptional regulator n=1 Tax=Sphingomonas sp. TaxID=28214 RepID=UPI0035A978BA|nr:helix-turn-helix domain-containing protein [Sphingomonas sp.]